MKLIVIIVTQNYYMSVNNMSDKAVDTDNDYSERTELITEEEQEENSDIQLSKWRQNLMLAVILSLQFVSLCTDTFLFPFFPQEAMRKGLTETHIGLVFSAYELTRFVVSPFAGSLVVRFTPKTMCIAGSVLTTLSCVAFGRLYYTPDKIFFPLCLVVRLIAGGGSAMLTVSAMTLLLKSTSYQAGTIAGLMEGVIAASYAVGPAVGAVIYQFVGYPAAFWTFGGVMVVLSVVQIFVIPATVGSTDSSKRKSFLELLKIPGLILMFANSFVIQIGSSSRMTLISSYIMVTFKQSATVIGLLFVVWASCYMLTCPLISIAVNRNYIYSSMVLSWSISILVTLFMGPSPLLNFVFHGKKYFWLTVVMQAISAFVTVTAYVPSFKASIDIAEVNGHPSDSVHTYGMVTGLINCAYGLGSMVGPIVAGAITKELDFSWTITIVGFLNFALLSLMVIYLAVMKVTNRPLSLKKMHS